MPVGTVRPALALVVFWYGATASPAHTQRANNQAGFLNSGQTATLDCAGGQAEIMGSNNVLTITGQCSGLELAGSGNKITIQFGCTFPASIHCEAASDCDPQEWHDKS